MKKLLILALTSALLFTGVSVSQPSKIDAAYFIQACLNICESRL
ncbi:hypothetical protein [Macrococcoides canis]|nr:hypothetical protein [Macrococcus canis]MEE1106390.1 hypothetical protein [Macrococcus canis]